MFKKIPATLTKTPATDSQVLQLSIKTTQASPEQMRFNQLLKSVETTSKNIKKTELMADTYRPLFNATLQQLEERRNAAVRDMAMFLHQRLQRKGLTKPQQTTAKDALCSMAAMLAMQGDEPMRELLDQYRPTDDDASQQDDGDESAMDGLAAMLDKLMGRKPGGSGDERDDDDDDEETLHDNTQRQHASEQHETQRVKHPWEIQAEQQQAHAQSTLRTIYRQLASALHPDRERDPQEHARKSALMSEVNIAYERRDLLALLALQLRIEQIDPDSVARMSREKLQGLTHLLVEQNLSLKFDLRQLKRQLCMEFDLDRVAQCTAAGFKRELALRKAELEDDIAKMAHDLARVQDDRQLKMWLKEMKQATEAMENCFGVFSDDANSDFDEWDAHRPF